MRWGVYARDGHPAAEAFALGLRGLGHVAAFRSLSDYGPNDREAFDAVAVVGLRGRGATILAEYEAAGVPVAVIDYGYLSRVHGVDTWPTGYWQVGIGGLNKVAPFACASDRFDSLGISLAPPVSRKGPTVLCLQSVGDAAHPFDTDEKLAEFVASVPHDEVRAHPLDDVSVEPLAKCLARAGKVVTWNSNVGHDALIAGVPVDVLGDAPYAGVDMAERGGYFARVAYSQWTADELSTGLAQAFLIDHWIPGNPPVVAADAQRTESKPAAKAGRKKAG